MNKFVRHSSLAILAGVLEARTGNSPRRYPLARALARVVVRPQRIELETKQ